MSNIRVKLIDNRKYIDLEDCMQDLRTEVQKIHGNPDYKEVCLALASALKFLQIIADSVDSHR